MAKLEVIVKDERGGKTQTSIHTMDGDAKSPSQALQTSIPKTNEAVDNSERQKALAVATMLGSRAFSYVQSNVGRYTGNSRNQQIVNNAMQIGSFTAMAYASPVMAVAVTGVTLTTTAIDTAYELKWDRASARRRQLQAGELIGRRH